jgi:hypothetical protein
MFRNLIVGSSTSVPPPLVSPSSLFPAHLHSINPLPTEAILGLSAASVTSSFAGPAGLAFVIGSSIGFVGGTLHYYSLCLHSAPKALDQLPSLMRLHLRTNYPLKHWEQIQVNRESINSTWELQSCAVAAWESAGQVRCLALMFVCDCFWNFVKAGRTRWLRVRLMLHKSCIIGGKWRS